MSYLYAKETESSFEIEHIKPNSTRTERLLALKDPLTPGIPVLTLRENWRRDSGYLSGFVWTENVGWLHFKNALPAYGVRTTAFDAGVVVTGGTVFEFR
jgi:hypothetical protein